jgi:hypothetical protein
MEFAFTVSSDESIVADCSEAFCQLCSSSSMGGSSWGGFRGLLLLQLALKAVDCSPCVLGSDFFTEAGLPPAWFGAKEKAESASEPFESV